MLSKLNYSKIKNIFVKNRRKNYSEKRPKILVLGTGWGSFKFIKAIDKKYWDVSIISPRNHFIFTPLLASTTVGTLEFRAIVEPIRLHCQNYIQATCEKIDSNNKKIICYDNWHSNPIELTYDYLVIGVGAQAATFGIPGVKEHCHFLKQINDARLIRRKIIDCFEKATSPHCTKEEREMLLSFIIVGGGPTSIEFSSEFYDFLKHDFSKLFPELKMDEIKIYLIEASDHILGTFDKKLWTYTENKIRSRNIILMTGVSVKEVQERKIFLNNDKVIPFGLCVWSTGNMPCDLVKSSNFKKDVKSGRLLVDSHLKLIGEDNIFAIGDCSSQQDFNLPQTAQCAQQEGYYLAKLFKIMQNGESDKEFKKFKYIHHGAMSYIGGYQALVDINHQVKGKGIFPFIIWRSAYFTKLLTYRKNLGSKLNI